MKLDEIALHSVLKAYGNELKTIRPDKKIQKPDISTKTEDLDPEKIEGLKIAQYDQNGKVRENTEKKQQIIDFFE